MIRPVGWIASITLLTFHSWGRAEAPCFHRLGGVSADSYAMAPPRLSGDGRVVFGARGAAGVAAPFRWTSQDGLIPLDAGGFGHVLPRDVSTDGTTFAGEALTGTLRTAVRWTKDTGVRSLGINAGPVGSWAWGVSGDGLTIIGGSGQSGASSYAAFRWDGGALFVHPATSEATAISRDGAFTVGTKGTASVPVQQLFINGERLDFAMTPTSVSSGSPVVVGYGEGFSPAPGTHALLFHDGMTQPQVLDFPSSGVLPPNARALDVSDDGRVVVGEVSVGTAFEPFIWDPIGQMRLLTDVLSDCGLGPGLSDWQHLLAATSVSDDGQTIVGWGINTNGQPEEFIFHIPEPASLMTILLGAGPMIRRCRRT